MPHAPVPFRFPAASSYETAPTLVGVGAVVGIPGFEPGAPCSRSRCANRTALHPVCVKRRKDNAFSTNSQSDRLPRRKNAPSADHSRPIRPNRLTATIFQTALARRSESPGSSSIPPGRPIPSPPVPNAPRFLLRPLWGLPLLRDHARSPRRRPVLFHA